MTGQYKAVFFRNEEYPKQAEDVFKFRKRIFIDTYKWELPSKGELEQDAFDHIFTITCALYKENVLVGTFRATEGHQPNVSAWVFQDLAHHRPWPKTPDTWEISRFGVVPEDKQAAALNYALMLYFGQMMQAKALFATTDLIHERLLRTLFKIKTERFGEPQQVGTSTDGTSLWAVAGQIPLSSENDTAISPLLNLLEPVEIQDDSNVFGYQRLSA